MDYRLIKGVHQRMRWAGIGLVALMLSSCSVGRFVYDRADWFIMVEIDSQFDLTDEQRDQFEPQLSKWVSEVKKNQVPEIIAILDEIRFSVRDGLSDQEVDQIWKRMRALRAAAFVDIAPDAAAVLAQLTPMQLDFHQKQLLESNETYETLAHCPKEDFADEMRDFVDDISDNIEDWIGDLSPAQQGMIDQYYQRDQAYFQQWLQYRQNIQVRWVQIMKQPTSAQVINDKLQAWAKGELWYVDTNEMTWLKQRRVRWRKFLLKLDSSVSDKQRTHFIEKIESWRDKLVSYSSAA